MCYDKIEVNAMEQEQIQEVPVFVPRPRWQVWGARIALAVFVVVLILLFMVQYSETHGNTPYNK